MRSNEIIRMLESAANEIRQAAWLVEVEADALSANYDTKQTSIYLYMEASILRGQIEGIDKAISLIKTHETICKS